MYVAPLSLLMQDRKLTFRFPFPVHADESLAIFLLKLLPRYSAAELVRSRNPEDWAKATVVVDVGGEYDAEKLRFDHHQRGFTEVFGNGFKTKLSSAGLVYK